MTITAFDLAGNSFTVDQTDLQSSNVIIDTSSPMVARPKNAYTVTMNVSGAVANASVIKTVQRK